MGPLSSTRLTAVVIITGIAGWAITWSMLRSGSTPLPVPITVPIVAVIAAGVALWLGWQVRAYLKGNRPDLDPLQAARTAVFAQATAYSGAVLLGVAVGHTMALLPDIGHEPRREVILTAAIAALASAGMLAAGIVAERWCRHDVDEDDASQVSPA